MESGSAVCRAWMEGRVGAFKYMYMSSGKTKRRKQGGGCIRNKQRSKRPRNGIKRWK